MIFGALFLVRTRAPRGAQLRAFVIRDGLMRTTRTIPMITCSALLSSILSSRSSTIALAVMLTRSLVDLLMAIGLLPKVVANADDVGNRLCLPPFLLLPKKNGGRRSSVHSG